MRIWVPHKLGLTYLHDRPALGRLRAALDVTDPEASA